MKDISKNKLKVTSVSLKIDTNGNKILEKVVAAINSNVELKTLWKIMNVNAINRLGMTDHGPTHFQIVANNGLKMIRLISSHHPKEHSVADFGLGSDYSEIIVFLGCILHDLGMSIHREGHEEFSLILARKFISNAISFLSIEERTVVTSEVLHAIISHRSGGKPNTLEAGIVRVADALDMSEGRSRIPYNRGLIDIHSVSANAISRVEIVAGKQKAIDIKVVMTNPAGIFQVDDLMKDKLKGSGIERYVEVKAYLITDGKEKLFKEFDF